MKLSQHNSINFYYKKLVSRLNPALIDHNNDLNSSSIDLIIILPMPMLLDVDLEKIGITTL